MTRCDHTPAWAALQQAFDTDGKALDVRRAFETDPQRFAKLSQSAPHVFADLSKNRIDTATESLLMDLARQCGVAQRRDAMFALAIAISGPSPGIHCTRRYQKRSF